LLHEDYLRNYCKNIIGHRSSSLIKYSPERLLTVFSENPHPVLHNFMKIHVLDDNFKNQVLQQLQIINLRRHKISEDLGVINKNEF